LGVWDWTGIEVAPELTVAVAYHSWELPLTGSYSRIGMALDETPAARMLIDVVTLTGSEVIAPLVLKGEVRLPAMPLAVELVLATEVGT